MVQVGYRPGLEHAAMKAPGGLRRILGKVDGLSKTFVWSKANGYVVEMADADAKVVADHIKNGGLATTVERDFLDQSKIAGEYPEMYIGEAAIKQGATDFEKRYAPYREAAAALAAADSDEIPL